ncbi:DUF1566 domain-containing protein [Deltaproteobacteria bacterium TL4]
METTDNKTFMITPVSNLTNDTSYSVRIKAGASDTSSNRLGTDYLWGFSTIAATTATTTSVVTIPVPDTEQITSFTNTSGEDHDYLINAPSYTDNGNGTTTDNGTGLIWQKQDDAVARTWAAAGTYCSGLNLGGYSSGWRLPTPRELMSIMDFETYNPAINSTYFSNTLSQNYWSSTTSANDASKAWYVAFGYGGVYDNPKTNTYYVRCVQGGSDSGIWGFSYLINESPVKSIL